MKKTFLFLMAASVCLFFSIDSFAALHFKITCDDPILSVGEQTTINIHIMDPDAGDDYGVILWQFDMWPDMDGIAKVVSWAVEPWFAYESGYGPESLNLPTSGNVNAFYAMASDLDQVSNIGTGDYTRIASITIEGLTEGQFQYDLGNRTTLGFYGVLRGSMEPQQGYFDTDNSVSEYRVVPEPSTLVMLGVMGLFLVKSRKSGRL